MDYKYFANKIENYEKTKSFWHDVKNHISIVKELVQNGNIDAALKYMSDMENLTADMSFPVSTNNGEKFTLSVLLIIPQQSESISQQVC